MKNLILLSAVSFCVGISAGCRGKVKFVEVTPSGSTIHYPTEPIDLHSSYYYGTGRSRSRSRTRRQPLVFAPGGFSVSIGYIQPSSSSWSDTFGPYPVFAIEQSISSRRIDIAFGLSHSTASFVEDGFNGADNTLDMKMNLLELSVRSTFKNKSIYIGGGVNIGSCKMDYTIVNPGPTYISGSDSANVSGIHFVTGIVVNGLSIGFKHSILGADSSDQNVGGVQLFAGYKF